MSGRVAVTGATGFVGSAIVRRLEREGRAVLALSSADLDLLHADAGEVERLFASHQVGGCIHAAWYTNHADYLTHPVNRDWVVASLRLADGFLAAGGRRFVALGSCAEYALDRLDGPCVERVTPVDPATLYGQCKRDLFEALQDKGLDFAWARIFFVYGPGDRGGRLVPSLLAGFRDGQPLAPRFGGLRRDYIHVDDLADQIVRLFDCDLVGAVNTGTEEAPSLAQIYQAMAAAFGVTAEPANAECGEQPPLIVADLDRLRGAIGAPGCRSIAEGLARMASR